MTFTEITSLQWVFYSVIGVIVVFMNYPKYVCLPGWFSRYKRLNDRYTGAYYHVAWYVYFIIWVIAAVMGVLGLGFVWSKHLVTLIAVPGTSSSIFISGQILGIISMGLSAFWSSVFFGHMLPRKKETRSMADEDEEEESETNLDVDVRYAVRAGILLFLSLLTGIVAIILLSIVNIYGLFFLGFVFMECFPFYNTIAVIFSEYQ